MKTLYVVLKHWSDAPMSVVYTAENEKDALMYAEEAAKQSVCKFAIAAVIAEVQQEPVRVEIRRVD